MKYLRKRQSDYEKAVSRKALIAATSEEVGYFDEFLFIPFHLSWQVLVTVSVLISCLSISYSAFFFKQIRLPKVQFEYIDPTYSMVLVVSSEIIFLFDLLFLILHKFSYNIRIRRPYKEVSLTYILISLATVIPSLFNIYTVLYHDENLKWSLIKIIVFVRFYRNFTIYYYLMNSVYFSRTVIIYFFISMFSAFTTLLTICFVQIEWRYVSVSSNYSAEEVLARIAPMLNSTKFEAWKMKTQQDVFLFVYYLITDMLLGRGDVAFSPVFAYSTLLYQFCMVITMFIRIILTTVFSAIDIHVNQRNVEFNGLKEKLRAKLKYTDLSQKTYSNILNWYDTLWNKREGIFETKTAELLPAGLYLECCLDAYYPALQHSHIFQERDITFLSSISVIMKTVFHSSGDVLYRKGMLRDAMCYIHIGIVHVMSCFDDSTPIVSLFPGSCFGESTLFVSYPCSIKIVCATYCELKILKKKAFCAEVTKFPSHYKAMQNDIFKRYNKATVLFAMKELKINSGIDGLIGIHEDGPLKRIKRISREIERTMDSRSNEKFDLEDKINKMTNLEKINPEYIGTSSDYLDLVVIRQAVDENEEISFITTSCPVIFHPISPFIKFWNFLILICVVVMVFLIPYEAGLGMTLNYVPSLSIGIQIMFILDLIVQCTFAVQTTDKMLVTVSDIFYYRVGTREYKADILGSVPLNFLVTFYESVSLNTWGLLKFNYILRAWRIVSAFNNAITESYDYRKLVLLFSYTCYFFCFICYWSMIFSILSCYNNECVPTGLWVMTEGTASNRDDPAYVTLKTMLKVLILCLGESGNSIQPYQISEHAASLIMSTLFLFFDAYIVAGIIASEVHSITTHELDKHTVISVVTFYKQYELKPSLVYRINRQIKMLQYMRKVHCPFSGNKDVKGLSKDLRKEIKLSAWVNTILKVPLFINTDRKYLVEVIDHCQTMMLPPNETVVYSGIFTDYMYIIKKGYCQIISESGNVEGVKGKGWSFAALELVLNIPLIKTIRTLTSCEFLIIGKPDLYATLHHFPDHKKDIDITKTKCRQLFDLPIVEGAGHIHFKKDMTDESFHHLGYDMAVGSKAEKEFLGPFIRMFGNFTAIRFLLLRSIVLPSGKAIWIFEIIRACLALCSCLLFPAKILFIYDPYYYQALFLFLDISAYIDIYLRLHFAYYNNKRILVKHPLMTAIHYLQNGFILDLLGCFPFERIFSNLIISHYTSIWLSYNRVLQIHRIIGLLTFIYTNKINAKPYAIIAKYFIILVVTINLVASISFIFNCEVDKNIDITFTTFRSRGVYCPAVNLTKWEFGVDVTPLQMYILFQFFITTLVAQLDIRGVGEWSTSATGKFLICMFGYFFTVYLTGHISALIFNQNIGLTFQRNVTRFMKFLDKRGAHKDLKEEFKHFYNTVWKYHQGRNPKENLQIFNEPLRCDIIYSVYGKYLKEYTIFAQTKDTTFFRSILLLFDPLIYHKGAVIINEGFVHDNIFILNEGYVNVLTGKRFLMILQKGAFFGNLFSSNLTQQSTTFVADTAVEVMVLKTDTFFNVLNAYPQYKEIFKRNLDKYLQKGVCVIPSVPLNPEEGHPIPPHHELFTESSYTKKFIFSTTFDYFKAATAFLSSITVVYSIAYQEFTIWMVMINYIFDITTMIIIIIKCNKPYQNSIGGYETDVYKIRLNYRSIKLGFWIDIMSVIPFETLWFVFKNQRRAYLYLHFNRIMRYILFLTFLEEQVQKISSHQFSARIIHLIIHLYTVLYVLAAFLALVHSYYDRSTIPAHAFIRWRQVLQIITLMFSNIVHYPHLVMVPHFYTMVILCRNIQMVIAIIINAVITGYFLFFTEVYCYNLLNYLETKYTILFSLALQRIGKFLHTTTNIYLKFLWDFNQGCHRPEILSIAPKTLQLKLFRTLYNHHFKNHFIFSNCQNYFIDQILLFLTEELILPGNTIVKSGIIDNTMYFIHRGEVREYSVNEKGKEKLKNVLLENEIFGIKQGLYEHRAHTSTYKAYTTAIILKLNFKSWSYLFKFFPVEEQRIYRILEKRGSEILPQNQKH